MGVNGKVGTHFGFTRVGIVSPECRVADPAFNGERLAVAFDELHSQGCAVALSPEMGLSAYTLGDLVYQSTLLEAVLNSLESLVSASVGRNMLCVAGSPLRIANRIYNCAIVFANGQILGVVPKICLPNTHEFYDKRFFATGRGIVGETISLNGQEVPFGIDLLFCARDRPDLQVGIEICEDLWGVEPPSGRQALAGATLLLNPSASNEVLGKYAYRRDLLRQQSARCLAAYAYVSSGPGESTTDTVFGGYGAICENGSILAEIGRFHFSTEILVVDVDIEHLVNERLHSAAFMDEAVTTMRRITFEVGAKTIGSSKLVGRTVSKYPFIPVDVQRRTEHCEEIFAIQVAALSKRLKHTLCERVVIGVSGGLDSTLALLVAIRAFELLGLSRFGIVAVTMPGFGTTGRTYNNAIQLCAELSLECRQIDIRPAVLQHFHDIGHTEKDRDVVFENSQARERTQVLMDIANKESAIVLGTGDLSESALGWCTFNGDHMSMYHVNVGVPKTLVRYMVHWCAQTQFGPKIAKLLLDICDTPISPELLPAGDDGQIAQITEEQVGPYALHDFYLFHVVRNHFSPLKVLYLANQAFGDQYDLSEIKHWLRVFYQRFFGSQFKRSSVPDGPKVGSVALSPRADWRMPSDASVSAWIAAVDEVTCMGDPL
jgi:NAD+ synthase (glutamine-hydrolysing)